MPDIKSAHRSQALSVSVLYTLVLNCGGQIPSFCQKLEQIILMGQRAFGAASPPYLTPKDYIFRFFYGDKCYIDGKYQIAVGNLKGILYYIAISLNADNNELTSSFSVSDIINRPHWFRDEKVLQCFRVAGETDHYIRRVRRFQGVLSCWTNERAIRPTENMTLRTYRKT